MGTFDVSANVLSAIDDGRLLFTTWQQPYLQGYLPVMAAAQYVRHGMTPPGEVPTGPIIVTRDNLEKVQDAQDAGLG